MAIIGCFRAVGISVVEREEKTVVAIGEKAGVDKLYMPHLVIFDLEDVHAVRIAFKSHSLKEGVRLYR